MSNIRSHTCIDGIKIYDGTTKNISYECQSNINYFTAKTQKMQKLFSPLVPSTLTAQGELTGVEFLEKDLIERFKKPEPPIMMIGCNFGEHISDGYVPPPPKVKKPNKNSKDKEKTKRKVTGNGKYFASQISFYIKHPKTNVLYKIKLFRNGVFQVPGVTTPSMKDLIIPIQLMRNYIQPYFDKEIQILDFMAVMRNYKTKLLNKHLHVDLELLEELLYKEKIITDKHPAHAPFYRILSSNMLDRLKKYLPKCNPMRIAEITYNTERCISLIVKFNRPSLLDKTKQVTVKLLKKGKINFDGGNSEIEIQELYAWFEYIYNLHCKDILCDIRQIKNTSDTDTDEESIYSGDDAL